MITQGIVTQPEKPIFPPFDSHPRLVQGVIVALLVCCLRTFNWRRFAFVRRVLISIGWDKFQRLDLTVAMHKCNVAMVDALMSPNSPARGSSTIC